MPNTMHSSVAAIDVRRLSHSAATEDSEVISGKNSAQFTRLSIATSGSSTNSAPTAATPTTQRGTPANGTGRTCASLGLTEPGRGEHGLAGLAGDEGRRTPPRRRRLSASVSAAIG